MKQNGNQSKPIDLSTLPTYGFGSRMTMWWGSLGFMAIETMGFALALGLYLYLAVVSSPWPPGIGPPDLLWSTILTIVLLASLVPNHVVLAYARCENLRKVRLYLVAMSALGILPLFLRAFEFTTVNVRWDQNAYGSIVWLILGLHTTHLVTDVVDTLVLTALMFTRHAHGRRFSDVEDNAVYWDFVALSWLPIYLLLYWFPRL
jgi:heme/copper-type cytochrome/quinol oxidase subunit 3